MKNKINGLRFIVGSECNYNCFYCHKEGFCESKYIEIDDDKLEKLYQYAIREGINSIAITGGEPFLYWENTKKILSKFNDPCFKITLNSNFSLLDLHYDEIIKFNCIEFHVNLSSLNNKMHQQIIGQNYLERVKNNLSLLKNTHHVVCLNVLATKNNDLREVFSYSIKNGFLPRILVLMPVHNSQKELVITIPEILKLFNNPKIDEKYAYGIYKVTSDDGNFEIIKCLCDDLECEICAQNTFMHLTPDLNIKYCLKSDDIVECNYENLDTLDEGFAEAQKRLVRRIK